MKKLLLFVLLFCSQFSFGQVRINLDNQLSVTFPINPTKTKTGADSYVYSANQNGAFYIATVTKMSKQFDYSTNADSLQHFYDDQLNTTVKKVNGKVDYKQSATVGSAKGFEFGYTLDTKGAFPDMRFQRSVYLNKTLYSFQFWTFKDKLEVNTADREVFFNTISTPKEQAPPAPYANPVKATATDTIKTQATTAQTQTTVTRNPAGYYTGVILGCLILGFCILWIIRLIIKTSANKRKTPVNKKKK